MCCLQPKHTSLILLFSPVQLVLLTSSAGRFALQVTTSSVMLRMVKTVFSKFISCSDLKEPKQISQSRMCDSLSNIKCEKWLLFPHTLLRNWRCALASFMKSSCCTSSGVSLKEEAGLSYKVVALQLSTNNNCHLTSAFWLFYCLKHGVEERYLFFFKL